MGGSYLPAALQGVIFRHAIGAYTGCFLVADYPNVTRCKLFADRALSVP